MRIITIAIMQTALRTRDIISHNQLSLLSQYWLLAVGEDSLSLLVPVLFLSGMGAGAGNSDRIGVICPLSADTLSDDVSLVPGLNVLVRWLYSRFHVQP